MEEPIIIEAVQPVQVNNTIEIWDLVRLSGEQLDHSVEYFGQAINDAKCALQANFTEDFTLGTDPSNAENLSALYQSQVENMVTQRLKLIRHNLKTAIIEQYLPHVQEIVELRDRLASRRRLWQMSLHQPLKCSIVADICARLTQKIVLKVLYL